MKQAFKDFIRELLFTKGSDAISKTKAGVWLGVIFYILKVYEVVDTNVYYALLSTAGGLLGIGIRDIAKK